MNRVASLLAIAPALALGCTNAPAILPRAIVDVDVRPSFLPTITAGSCAFGPGSDLVSVGCAGTASRCTDNDDGSFLAVAHGARAAGDGTPDGRGGEVHVYCAVTRVGTAFDIRLSALRYDAEKPTEKLEQLTIEGRVDPAATEDQQVTVSAFKRGTAAFVTNPPGLATGSHTGLGCVISCPEATYMHIAPGRIWARVSCPDAYIPGSDPVRMCDVSGTFRFENCTD